MASVGDLETKGSFSTWLCEFFKEHSIDEDVYLEYVVGILDTGEGTSPNELISSLEEILIGVLVNEEDAKPVSSLIVQKYFEYSTSTVKELSLDSILDMIPEHTANTTAGTASKTSSEEGPMSSVDALSREQKRRLIKTYGTDSDEDDHASGDEEASSSHRKPRSAPALVPNTNTASVVQKQKEMRVMKKKEHETKVERDKQSRQKQLQKEIDRKEKEKKRTQKQEKRR